MFDPTYVEDMNRALGLGFFLLALGGVGLIALAFALMSALAGRFNPVLWGFVAFVVVIESILFGPPTGKRWQKDRLDRQIVEWANQPARTDLPRAYDGRGLYFPEITDAHPSICPPAQNTYLPSGCLFMPLHWLATGLYDYVETGTDPVRRWSFVGQGEACFHRDPLPIPFRSNAFVHPLISRSQGGCVMFQEVEAPMAKVEVTATQLDTPPFNDRVLAIRLALTTRDNHTLLDEYYAHHGSHSRYARNADGPLKELFTNNEIYNLEQLKNAYFRPDTFDNQAFRASLVENAKQAIGEICSHDRENLLSEKNIADVRKIAAEQLIDGMDPRDLYHAKFAAQHCTFPNTPNE